jgi:DUF4097 and DUF4098 domain-containing protein YvlB
MQRTLAAGIALAALLPFVPADLSAQAQWSWNRTMSAGQTLEIKGINGDIRAVAARGSEARVNVTKTARRSNVDDVEMVVVEHNGGVTICAIYPTPRNRPQNECRPGGGGRNSSQNNDVQVNFTIEVPAGVHFAGRNVNGAVHADGLTGNVDAHTVNGAVRLSTQGLARARTVNGAIEVRMGRADWNDTSSFETVNGGITLTVAGDLNADIRASTVNGNITSDFPVTVQGRFGPRSVNGTIGSGGRTLALKTVNGSISLKRP